MGLLETRFEARNCISEPCPQEPYRDIFFQSIVIATRLIETEQITNENLKLKGNGSF
jgi:hypothetical protein